jgi:hypothetical protein
VLSLPFCLNMSPSTTPGSSAAAGTQFLRRRRWPSSRRERLGTSIISHNPLPGGLFRSLITVHLRYDLLSCSPPWRI